METATFDHPNSIAAAIGVLDRHLAALNAGDASALAQTLHFPHYRLAGSRMTIWEGSETYLQDFHARAGGEWHHSAWDFRRPIGSVSLHMGRELYRSALGCAAAVELCPVGCFLRPT